MHAARKILSVDTGLLRTDLQDMSLVCVSLNTGSCLVVEAQLDLKLQKNIKLIP